MGVEVDRLVGDRRRVHHARRVQAAQDTADHVVEARPADLAALQRGGQWLFEPGLAVEGIARRFLVQAGIGRLGGRVVGAPVGHDITLVAPLALQHVVQQPLVFAGIDVVDAVIGAHHRAGIAPFDRELEGQQIGHARLVVVEVRADEMAAGFLGVDGVVLDRRDDVVRLDTGNFGADNGAGQQRVFAAIFEIAAVSRFAQQIDAARQHDIEAGIARFGTDHGAALIGQVGVPGRRSGQTRRQRCPLAPMIRIVLSGHTNAGVGLPFRRNPKPGNARHIACRRPSRFRWMGILVRYVRTEVSEDQIKLFCTGHATQQKISPLIGDLPGARSRYRCIRGFRLHNQGDSASEEETQCCSRAAFQTLFHFRSPLFNVTTINHVFILL